MKKYTLGYIFKPDLKKVLLVHKLDPEWQNGKINGVGGKVEEGESALNCIVREIKEETNLSTDKEKWIHLGNIHGEGWYMDLFVYLYRGNINDAQKTGKEKIEWFDPENLPKNVIPNLRWQIPLALEKIQYNALKSFSMEYEEVIEN